MTSQVFQGASVEQARREARVSRRELSRSLADEDFRWLMQQQRGRRIVWRLLQRSRFSDPAFSKNAMLLARHTGIKEFGETELRNRIDQLCPELWPVMVTENQDD